MYFEGSRKTSASSCNTYADSCYAENKRRGSTPGGHTRVSSRYLPNKTRTSIYSTTEDNLVNIRAAPRPKPRMPAVHMPSPPDSGERKEARAAEKRAPPQEEPNAAQQLETHETETFPEARAKPFPKYNPLP